MKAIDNDSENKLWMKMTVFVKWIMNENDSISEIEWIWENRWKWITKKTEYWWKWKWIMNLKFVKVNYEWQMKWIMNLQFVKVNYEWQMKWIKRSYGFKISNGYDEEFNEGLDLWICKDSKIRKFITFWQEPIILKSLIFTGAPHTSACSLILEKGGLAKGRLVRQLTPACSFARLRRLRDVEPT